MQLCAVTMMHVYCTCFLFHVLVVFKEKTRKRKFCEHHHSRHRQNRERNYLLNAIWSLNRLKSFSTVCSRDVIAMTSQPWVSLHAEYRSCLFHAAVKSLSSSSYLYAVVTSQPWVILHALLFDRVCFNVHKYSIDSIPIGSFSFRAF